MLLDEDMDDLWGFFLRKNYKWTIDGELTTPTRNDLKSMIENCIEMIRKQEGSISIESGSLLIKRSDNYVDVYCHVAQLKLEENK